MAKKTKRVTLGQDEYEVTQLGATEAYDLYNDLIGAIGPALQGKLQELQELAKAEELDEVRAGLVVLELKRNIPRELMRDLRSAFARTSKVRMGSVFLDLGEQGVFDQHFAGRMGSIDAWMIACAKHSFMGFLSEAGASSSRQDPEIRSE